jgi:hypothetical protein
MVHRSTLTAATATGMMLAATASAEDKTLDARVRWIAPAECPTEAEVRAEARAIQGGATPAGQVDARAVVTSSGSRWHVDLTVVAEHGSGERSFDASSCRELANAVALIVALRADSTQPPLSEKRTSAKPQEEPTATPPSGLLGAERPTQVPPRGGDGPRLSIATGGVLDVGLLPRPGAGGTVAVGVLLGRARIEAHASLLASQRARDPARQAQGVDVEALGAGARGCFALLPTEGVTVAPCLGVGVERLASTGFGGDSTFARESAWLSAEAGGLGTWAIGRFFALRAGAGLVLPTARPKFVVLAPDGSVADVLHKPAATTVRLELGAELKIF